LEFTPAALRQFKRLGQQDTQLVSRIMQAVVALEDEPRPPGCKKLRGLKNSYRIRIGDYRVLYDILDDRLLITVVSVGHRREVF
jgi:mRNA interferase RelE/StbE